MWDLVLVSCPCKLMSCDIVLFFLPPGLCLVEHESEFEYDAVNTDTKDYGIFQINKGYWCKGGPKYSACWQINTYGCGVTAADCPIGKG